MAVTTNTSGEEEERPVCNHGVSTTTAVIQTEGKCPHDDGALQSYVLCEGRVQDFQQKHQRAIKILELDTGRYRKLNLTSNYKMAEKPEDDRTEFNFLDLCKSNGEYYLGIFPVQIKNCNESVKVFINLREWDTDRWKTKLSLVWDIQKCEHPEACKFVTQAEESQELTAQEIATEVEKKPESHQKQIIYNIIAIIFAIIATYIAARWIVTRDEQKARVQPGDDYLTALSTLWGEETLKQVREYVRRGDIKGPAIKTMAAKMDVLRVYQESWHKLGLVDTFESMLEEWFDQTLFDLEPADARQRLVTVLRDSGCSKRVFTHIQRLCDS